MEPANPQYHRPTEPVLESGVYALLAPDGRHMHSWHLPAGAAFPVIPGKSGGYVLVGLPGPDC